jgi:Flp pilus assembly pilin Flp
MRDRATELYVRTSSSIRAVLTGERGASMVEYAFLVALIAMIAIVAVAFMGNALDDKYDSIGQSIAET